MEAIKVKLNDEVINGVCVYGNSYMFKHHIEEEEEFNFTLYKDRVDVQGKVISIDDFVDKYTMTGYEIIRCKLYTRYHMYGYESYYGQHNKGSY